MGLNKLRNLHEREVPPVPDGYCVPRDHEHGLQIQRDWLYYEMAPELVQDRMDLYTENLKRHQSPPSWLTLQPHEDLRNWSSIVEKDLEVESWAIDSFKEVLQTESLGVFEANRILAHMFKDSSSTSRKQMSRSKWTYTCCNEALGAMRNWEDWDCEIQKSLGKVWVKGDDNKWYWGDRPSSRPSGKGGDSGWSYATGWR